MSDLHPDDVAGHWPFLDRALALDRWLAGRRALSILARLLAGSGGEPVPMPRGRLTADFDLTAGEAGNLYRALLELERRDVVARYRGGGRRPDVWTLRAELARWRGLPWAIPAARAESAIRSCVCRADFAVAARFPGQSLALSRGDAEIALSEADHLPRPGLLSVDSRGYGESRAANANGHRERPGGARWSPVETRGYGEKAAAPVLPLAYKRRDVDDDGVDQRRELLEAAIQSATGGHVYGQPWHRLDRIAEGLSDDEAERVAAELATRRDVRSPVWLVAVAADLAAAARAGSRARDTSRSRHPSAGEEDPGPKPLSAALGAYAPGHAFQGAEA